MIITGTEVGVEHLLRQFGNQVGIPWHFDITPGQMVVAHVVVGLHRVGQIFADRPSHPAMIGLAAELEEDPADHEERHVFTAEQATPLEAAHPRRQHRVRVLIHGETVRGEVLPRTSFAEVARSGSSGWD
jgi:hypothetical protein